MPYALSVSNAAFLREPHRYVRQKYQSYYGEQAQLIQSAEYRLLNNQYRCRVFAAMTRRF